MREGSSTILFCPKKSQSHTLGFFPGLNIRFAPLTNQSSSLPTQITSLPLTGRVSVYRVGEHWYWRKQASEATVICNLLYILYPPSAMDIRRSAWLPAGCRVALAGGNISLLITKVSGLCWHTSDVWCR